MRKILIVILSLILFISPVYAKTDARTLGELKKELTALKNKKSSNANDKNKTQNQITSAQNDIYTSRKNIDEGKQKIEESKKEIEVLTNDINSTKETIKNLMNTQQLLDGDNIYLDYLFNAEDYADLVYRYALISQVVEYNKEQMDSYEAKVIYNEELQKDLIKKEEQLTIEISNLENKISKYEDRLEEITEIAMDIDEEIKAINNLIKYYEGLGCKDDQDLNQCVSVTGDTRFSKPLAKGTITSYFGYRIHPIYKVQKFHSGVDIGGNKEGTPIYSTANGKVAMIISNTSKKVCGGRQVFIHHTINGKKYTSAYLHLLDIKVKVGDTVTNTTVIGTVGGGSKTSSWESCSTGAHLHFTLANGWYGSTYTSYSTFLANTFDPQKTLNLPNKNTYWFSR